MHVCNVQYVPKYFPARQQMFPCLLHTDLIEAIYSSFFSAIPPLLKHAGNAGLKYIN
jgi:hypothetical protein